MLELWSRNRPPITIVRPSFTITLLETLVTDLLGRPAAFTEPLESSGWISMRMFPFSPMNGRKVSTVPVSRNLTLSAVAVSVVIAVR